MTIFWILSFKIVINILILLKTEGLFEKPSGMMRLSVLSEIQSRILLALLIEGELSSASITEKVGISGSSWSKEKRMLAAAGLIDCESSREITEKGVVRHMDFRLTRRGKQVAQNLLAISATIDDGDVSQYFRGNNSTGAVLQNLA
jgi:DNA-binding MarR family transcriptional regulator